MANTIKIFLFLLTMFLMGTSCKVSAPADSVSYDPELAASLQADAYGNKSYIMVILKTGPAQIEDPVLRDSLFRGHFSNMKQMAEAGQLVLAGPFGENPLSFRGIFILDTTSEAKARNWLQNDPTISHQIFEPLLLPWYGSAALPGHLEIHQRIQKEKL